MDSSYIAIFITLVTVVFLFIDKIEIPIVMMVSAILMGLFIPEMDLADIYKGFGTTTVMMVAGMSIVGDSIFQTGMSDKLGEALCKKSFLRNPRVFNVVVVATCLLMSSFLSNSGTIAMWIPLIIAFSRKTNGEIKSEITCMSAAIACAVGGAGTLIGSTAQQEANAILMSMTGNEMSLKLFSQTKFMLPLFAITIIYFATFGYDLQKSLFKDMKGKDEFYFTNASCSNDPREYDLRKARLSLLVMVLCILGFIVSSLEFFKPYLNVGVVGLIGAGILFATKCVPFKESIQRLDWNTIIILGFSSAIAKGIQVSGAGEIMADFIINVFGGEDASVLTLMIVGIVTTTILTNFMSNTVLAAIMSTIYINIAFSLGVSPVPFVVIICAISTNLAVATPIGTPALTQVLFLGYRFMDYVKVGGPLCILMVLALSLLYVVIY